MNEPLCRALLRARLSEEDVAARLQVDPKTVRRWIEGRVPYLRHRWALSTLTGVDESDLWPHLRNRRTRPTEIVAIYPSRDAVPNEVWLRLLGSARREIGILACSGRFLAQIPGVPDVLAGQALAGVRVRICLTDPALHTLEGGTVQAMNEALPARLNRAIAVYESLRAKGPSELRLHRAVLYGTICYADDQLLASQRAYGIPPGQAPVLHLQRADAADMMTAYLDSFECAWAGARPLE